MSVSYLRVSGAPLSLVILVPVRIRTSECVVVEELLIFEPAGDNGGEIEVGGVVGCGGQILADEVEFGGLVVAVLIGHSLA